MSDLRRWSREGATDTEASILESLKQERASSSAKKRALAAALGVGASIATTSATATGTTSLLAKILGMGVLIGGITAAGLAIHASHNSAKDSVPVASSPVLAETAAAAPSASAPSDPETAASPADSSDLAPSAAPSASADVPIRPPPASRPISSAASLSREIAELQSAHAANNPDATLRKLDEYHARFPQGSLSSEETVLRVQALLARGDTAKAVALANAFSAAHPESPYARRVQDLVRGAPKK